MIAARYICGFSLQIFIYAFFCLYPFWNRFRISRKKAVITALSVFAVLSVPFALVGQFDFTGVYEEPLCNLIFYLAVAFFLVLYIKAINVRLSEKLFVFFVVMSYGFFVTRLISFLFIAFELPMDNHMSPPAALLMTLIINLATAKPIMLLMDRVRMMTDAILEARIWLTLCVVPVLFVPIASAAFFPEILPFGNDIMIPLYFIIFTVFAFIVYAVIFRVMGYIRLQQEEYRIAELLLEGYRNQAESNERIREIHHDVKHHLNVLSAYMEQKDYTGAEQYLQNIAQAANHLPGAAYTAHPLINSILAKFESRAEQAGIRAQFDVVVDSALNMDDVDLCSALANMLENAVEGCAHVSQQQRYIKLKLYSKGNFLYFCCENSCDEGSLKSSSGRFATIKRDADAHGYGLRIIGRIAEKYNGILTTQVRDGVFTLTTNLCLVSETEEQGVK